MKEVPVLAAHYGHFYAYYASAFDMRIRYTENFRHPSRLYTVYYNSSKKSGIKI